MSAVRLAEQLGISSRNVEKNIKKLKEYGILFDMARQRMDTGRLLLKIKKEIYGENHGNKKHTDQRHHKRRKNPHSTGRLEPVRGEPAISAMAVTI